MKKIILISILMFSVMQFSIAHYTDCECGEHSTGIVFYTVDGTGCCSSPIALDTEAGKDFYYYNEGAWVYSHTVPMTSANAQKACCPPF